MARTHDPLTGADLRYFAMVGDYRVRTPTDLGLHVTREQAQAAITAHKHASHSIKHAKVVEVWVDHNGDFRDPPRR